ncbi:MAG: hypothetical protein R3E12_14690, partial [Candidatus Eisenbacteria bacterium]
MRTSFSSLVSTLFLIFVLPLAAARASATPHDEALDKLFPGLGDSPMGETLTIPETARGTSPLVSIGSWPFGSARATAADEDRQLLFYGMGGVVRTLDISDPANPTVVTDDLHTGGLVQELCYDGANQHLLVAAG